MSPPDRRRRARNRESAEALADRLAGALAAHPEGLSAAEVTKNVFGGNVSAARIAAAAELLLSRGLAARGVREQARVYRVPVLRAATPEPKKADEKGETP